MQKMDTSYLTTSSKCTNREMKYPQSGLEKAKREVQNPRKQVGLQYVCRFVICFRHNVAVFHFM